MTSQPTNFFLALLASALLPTLSLATDLPTTPNSTASVTSAASSTPTVPIDTVVAIVNSDVITQHELNERYNRAVQQLKERKNELPSHSILEKQLLDRMINDRIQLQFADQTGIKVDGPTLDRAIDKIAEQNKMTLAQFHDALAHDGVDFNKFRDDIRNEIILTRLRQREVDTKVNVTEAEVDNYLAQQAKQGTNNEYHLARIVIDIPDNASSEQIAAAQSKAADVLQKLRTGADFSKISTEYSNAQNALEGGDLGWRSAAQLPPEFLTLLQTLKPGDVSDILRSNTGFNIFKLVDERSHSQSSIIDQTHARHILIKTNEVVSDVDAQKKLQQIRQKILDGSAKFEDMAKQYSDDGSASKGGDLGWVSPGETVSQFEQAMDQLKPGEISQPIKSPFGYHLIQVLERRKQDVTSEHERARARQAIHDRKAEEAFTEWLRELRDRAYVEYRPLAEE